MTRTYCMTDEQSRRWEGAALEHAKVTEQIIADLQADLDDPHVGSVTVLMDTGEVAFQVWRE